MTQQDTKIAYIVYLNIKELIYCNIALIVLSNNFLCQFLLVVCTIQSNQEYIGELLMFFYYLQKTTPTELHIYLYIQVYIPLFWPKNIQQHFTITERKITNQQIVQNIQHLLTMLNKQADVNLLQQELINFDLVRIQLRFTLKRYSRHLDKKLEKGCRVITHTK